MKRTLAMAMMSGMAATTALGSIAAMGGGAGTLQAGAQSQNFNVPVPSNVNVMVNDPSQSSTASVVGTGTETANSIVLDVDFSGAGVTGVASMAYSTEITVGEQVDFLINGHLDGLVGYDLIFRPTDQSFQIREYLDYDEFGFFGTLVDDFFEPVSSFNVIGVLGAGTYELIVTMRTESLEGQPFDGTGGFTVTLSTVPAPSAALALGAPALLALRRRR